MSIGLLELPQTNCLPPRPLLFGNLLRNSRLEVFLYQLPRIRLCRKEVLGDVRLLFQSELQEKIALLAGGPGSAGHVIVTTPNVYAFARDTLCPIGTAVAGLVRRKFHGCFESRS